VPQPMISPHAFPSNLLLDDSLKAGSSHDILDMGGDDTINLKFGTDADPLMFEVQRLS
jgi:hypothetical protein